MERQALQNALQRLKMSLNVVEVVTDASTSIKKLFGKNPSITVLCIVCYSEIHTLILSNRFDGQEKDFEVLDIYTVLEFNGLVEGGESDDAAFKR